MPAPAATALTITAACISISLFNIQTHHCVSLVALSSFISGGKKGVDMAGMSDLGGVKFFNLSVETPEGDMELLEVVLQGERQQ